MHPMAAYCALNGLMLTYYNAATLTDPQSAYRIKFQRRYNERLIFCTMQLTPEGSRYLWLLGRSESLKYYTVIPWDAVDDAVFSGLSQKSVDLLLSESGVYLT